MENIGRTGIIPFSIFGSKVKLAGSSFLRAEGLVTNAPDFEIWQHGYQYDNLIFQKTYWKEMMELFKGPKILDLTDPDWLYGTVNIVEVGNMVDAITCSSEKLTQLVKTYFPHKDVVHIPDRLNFNILPEPRQKHEGKAKNVVWFGFIHNAHETLWPMLPTIREHNLILKIIAERPYERQADLEGINTEFIVFQHDTAYHKIKEADIVLNPKSTRAFYKYKSNNKTVTGWKLGVPTAETVEELLRFLDPDERNREVKEKSVVVQNEYNIISSATQYRQLFKKIRAKQ